MPAGRRPFPPVTQVQISRSTKIVSYAILTCGAGTILLTAYLVVAGYQVLPVLDGWSEIDFGANEGSGFVLDWLWRQQNQHRLVLPKLFLLADLRWFHATQVFLLITIFTVQLLNLLLLCWSMRQLGGWKGDLWRTGAGLAAFCLFCPSQWENFTWGFQTCFVLPGLFATLAFVGLLLYSTSGREGVVPNRWKYLAVSIAAAVGASYSLANGNLLWPLLVAAALLLRLPVKAILSYIVAGGASTALFLNNYTVYPATTSAARAPLAVLSYVATYFGSSWVARNVRVAEAIGLGGIALVLTLLLLLPSFTPDRPFAVQLLLTVMFCLGTSLITALGRLVYGVAQAFSSRYQTIALLFWCCLGLMVLGYAPFHRLLHRGGLLLPQAALLAVMVTAAFFAPTPIRDARLLGFQVKAAAAALMTDVPDREQLRWVDTHPDYVLSLVPYMRKERLSVFHGTLPSLLGRRLDSTFSGARAGECTGEVQSVRAVPGAPPGPLEITGWAWDDQRRRAPAAIVVTTNDVINGLGAVGGWRPAVREIHPEVRTNYSGFLGYVRDVPKAGPIEIYAVANGGLSACHIATINPNEARSP